jgi:hypothetical protein
MFDRFFEILCHFVTKMGRMFEFTLMSLIEGVILFYFFIFIYFYAMID